MRIYPKEQITTIVDKKKKVRRVLAQFCKDLTCKAYWEGANRSTVKDFFDYYTERIEQIYNELP
jgi:hypothetical protein